MLKLITLITILPFATFAMESTMEQEQTNSTLLTHLGQNAKSLADLEGIDINVQSDEDNATLLHKAIDYRNEQLIDALLLEPNLKFLENIRGVDPIIHTLHKRRFAQVEMQELYSNIAKKLIVKRLAEFSAGDFYLYLELMRIFDYALITYNYNIVKLIYDSSPFKTIHPEIQTAILEKILEHTKLTNNHMSHQEFQVEYKRFSRLATQMRSFNLDPYNVSCGFNYDQVSALVSNENFLRNSPGIQYKILKAIGGHHNYADHELGSHISHLIVKVLFKTRITQSTVNTEPTASPQSTDNGYYCCIQ